MANIFTKNEAKMNIIEKYLFILKRAKDIDKKTEFYIKSVKFLEQVQNRQIQNPFIKDEILVKLINNAMPFARENDFELFVAFAKQKFQDIVNEDDSSYLDFVKIMFLHQYDAPYSLSLYKTFSNKSLYFDIIDVVRNSSGTKNLFPRIESYIISVAQYFPDETVLKNNAIAFINGLKENNDIDKYIELKVREIKEQYGVYSIPESVVSRIDFKIKEFQRLAKTLDNLITAANERLSDLKKLPNDVQKEIADYQKSVLIATSAEINGLAGKLEEQRQKYLLMEKTGLSNEAADLTTKLKIFFEKCVQSLELQSNTITENTSKEIERVQEQARLYLDEITKGLNQKKADSQELLDLVSREVTPALQKILTQTKGIQYFDHIVNGINNGDGQSYNVPNLILSPKDEPEPITPVSPFLDRTKPYKKRFALLQDKMRKMSDQGIVMHAKTEEVLSSVIIGDNPYLIGPSGCGKSYLINQIAELLELKMVEIGRISDSSNLIGFDSAIGKAVITNFIRCFRNGYIAFLDEFDNNDPIASITINSFTSLREKGYMFPGGNEIMVHPNFRIIAAGNTSGSGSDELYCARSQIDESVQQRLTPLHIGYDGRVEHVILISYENWYQFSMLFREATDKYADQNKIEAAPGIFTTRDAFRIKEYLDADAKTMLQILECQFIQTKSIPYLQFLLNYLEEAYQSSSNSKSQKIYQIFSERTKEIISKHGRRW